MTDPTESTRRVMTHVINSEPTSRATLEKEFGQVWDTSQLMEDFEVLGFLAPFVMVNKKETGERGTLMFRHDPRFYFNFEPEVK